MSQQDPNVPEETREARRRTISLFGRTITLPQSRILRIALGVVLIVLGIVGFLPVLGFWMIPLGLLVLSFDLAFFRRMRRKLIVMNGKRKKSGNG